MTNKEIEKKPTDNTYVEELMKVYRPLRGNHIFNEVRYDKVVDTYDKEGVRLVVLREKAVVDKTSPD